MTTKPQPHHAGRRSHRPLGATFYGYVAREATRPAIFALLGLTTVILTKDLLGYSDLIINRGIGAGTVAAMAFFQAVPIAATMFPFAVLLGCLVALGRLGADREILTLEASGVPAARLMLPLLVFAGGMCAISFLFSMQLGPWAYRSNEALVERIRMEKPWSSMQKGEMAEFGGWRIEAREVSSDGQRLREVLMWMPDLGETIFARKGRMQTAEDGSVEILLQDGTVVLSTRKNARVIRFDAMRTDLPDREGPDPEDRDRRFGMSLDELLAWTNSRKAQMEFHRRFANPTACLVFGLLAGPLILVRRSFSRSGGSVLGIALTLTYYALAQLGEGLTRGHVTGEAMGVWLPNIVLTVVAVGLLVRVLRTNALGQAFDRPTRRERERPVRRREVAPGYRPHRYPLARYITARFLQLAALTFAVMMVAYLLINVMERLDWFARNHATGGEILRYYLARMPLLASRVVPMSLLVATALTVSVLAAEGELIGMRSCGIPAPRALLPVFIFSALMVPAFFALSDFVVPRTNVIADDVKENQIKDGRERRRQQKRIESETAWYRAGDQVISAERFDADNGESGELAIYFIGEDGHPVSRIDAAAARHVGGGKWRLEDARMVEIAGDTVRKGPAPRYAALGDVVSAEVSTSRMTLAALSEEIADMRADGLDVTAYEVDRHMRIATSLSCFILPALVLFFAVGGPPFPGPAQNLLVSIVVGVAYLMVSGVSASFGYGGTLPPALGGWAPNIVFSLIAGFFGVRMWGRM